MHFFFLIFTLCSVRRFLPYTGCIFFIFQCFEITVYDFTVKTERALNFKRAGPRGGGTARHLADEIGVKKIT